MDTANAHDHETIPTLVAIAVAAKRSGDRNLERFARERLRDSGIRLGFARDMSPARQRADKGVTR